MAGRGTTVRLGGRGDQRSKIIESERTLGNLDGTGNNDNPRRIVLPEEHSNLHINIVSGDVAIKFLQKNQSVDEENDIRLTTGDGPNFENFPCDEIEINSDVGSGAAAVTWEVVSW